jgi:hypothetical protein
MLSCLQQLHAYLHISSHHHREPKALKPTNPNQNRNHAARKVRHISNQILNQHEVRLLDGNSLSPVEKQSQEDDEMRDRMSEEQIGSQQGPPLLLNNGMIRPDRIPATHRNHGIPKKDNRHNLPNHPQLAPRASHLKNILKPKFIDILF